MPSSLWRDEDRQGWLSGCWRRTRGQIGLSAICRHELYYGADNSQRVSFNLETIRLLTQDFPIVPFEQPDAYATGEIRAALAEAGQTIAPSMS
jgi:tRNA(fMet)-specific endonuclease VapC